MPRTEYQTFPFTDWSFGAECGEVAQERNKPSHRFEEHLEAFGVQQELIITILQRMQKSDAEHHAVAATRQDMGSHEEQLKKLETTVEELRAYLDGYSARRRLTIYSLVMLFLSCLLFLAVVIRGSITVVSPFPELAILTSIAFLFMARYTPKHQR